MKIFVMIFVSAFFVLGVMVPTTTAESDIKIMPLPGLDKGSSDFIATAADTFQLAWFSFDPDETCDAEGWTTTDNTIQSISFHIDGSLSVGGVLDGGTFGSLLALEGEKSVWCGVGASASIPYCGYATLPGYGNGWDQGWTFSISATAAASLSASYLIQWASEPDYDRTIVEYLEFGQWVEISSVNGGLGFYDGTGSLQDGFTVPLSGQSEVSYRFRFISDDSGSDEDGLWPTDGAALIDSITTTYEDGTGTNVVFHDFETETIGAIVTADLLWEATISGGFGDFAALYPGTAVHQEDPCLFNMTCVWGFFDDFNITPYLCHQPNPLPQQGAIRFGPDLKGQYIRNEIYSPLIPNVGAGSEYILEFDVYRDLPLDNLVFYVWHVRSVVAGCPGTWDDRGFVYYSGNKDWLRVGHEFGAYVDPFASDIQVALGVWDMCNVWCGTLGQGACHGHAPLLDRVRVVRVNTSPAISVRHIDLFQDNFAADGTTTGTARADMAKDIAAAGSPTIQPGDSVIVTASSLGSDPVTGVGRSIYIYATIWDGQNPFTAADAADLEAPEIRAAVGKRYPLVATQTDASGQLWACYRMDSATTSSGVVDDRYCGDFNDSYLVPGDTVCYFFCGIDPSGSVKYWTRKLGGQGTADLAGTLTTSDFEAAVSSPMEFTILPAGGWRNGGDILYVDDADGHGPQLYFDSAFDMLGIYDKVDRYDVLGASSIVANGLASRVANVSTQIMACYRKIIWCSGNLEAGLVGDGTGKPEKSDDFGLLYTFLDQHPNDPGVYFTGDDLAEEWVRLAGAAAIGTRSIYVNFNLVSGDHVSVGEPVSPLLIATGNCFIHLGQSDSLIAYGGCPDVNDFDVLAPEGTSTGEFKYPVGANHFAVISQTTLNSGGSLANTILSGFSFNYIRDDRPQIPPDRVEHLRDILICLMNVVHEPVGIGDDAPQFAYYLDSAYPNPFNPSTTIRYGIKEQGHVSLEVFNVAGQRVKTLVNEVQKPAAKYDVTWDGRNDVGDTVASGVYFYRLVTRDFTMTRKAVLLK